MRGDESNIGGIYGFRPSINFGGSLGARAGFVWDRTLIYATGGYAFANMSVKNDALGLSDSNMLSGWMAGGGLEYLWSNDNGRRFGYRHVKFSK